MVINTALEREKPSPRFRVQSVFQPWLKFLFVSFVCFVVKFSPR
jgi:hypothetical protein